MKSSVWHTNHRNVGPTEVYANFSSQKPQFQVKKCSRDSWKILCYHQFTPIMLWSSAKTDLIHLLIHPIRSTALLLPKILWDTLENGRILIENVRISMKKNSEFRSQMDEFREKMWKFQNLHPKRENFDQKWSISHLKWLNFDQKWSISHLKWLNFDQKWPNFDRKYIENDINWIELQIFISNA